MIIKRKASNIFSQIKTNTNKTAFEASDGWYLNFSGRYNLHRVSCLGEKVDADVDSANDFKEWFQNYVRRSGYWPQQIFNADETGLIWKKTKNTTITSQSVSNMPGTKIPKERYTVLACANATGSIRIKHL